MRVEDGLRLSTSVRGRRESKKRGDSAIVFFEQKAYSFTKEEKKSKKLVVAAYRENAEAGRVHGSFLARIAHPRRRREIMKRIKCVLLAAAAAACDCDSRR